MTQTTETLVPDGDGFVELGHLEDQWLLLVALRKEVEDLRMRIDKGEQFFKDQMDLYGADGLMINGIRKVSYRQDATFPVARYSAENPHVAEVYKIMKPAFDLETFKRDRPEEYKQWRSRSYKYVQPKKGA
jgi:histidyl-tRNA synthetase